ncbi:NUDIX domain-containing protein [bacterium]|nr:NUDIX domain-containing protein [bacterium]
MSSQTQISAGILVFRLRRGQLELLLGHPGGPYFAHRDLGAWGIPKGHVERGEELLSAARREFEEETGFPPPTDLIPLGEIRQRGGKNVSAWAGEWTEKELPPLDSATFDIEWPPRSGRTRSFPELDQLRFFPVEEARQVMNERQYRFVERLVEYLGTEGRL